MKNGDRARELITELQARLSAANEMLDKWNRLKDKTYNLFAELIRDELPYREGDLARIVKPVRFLKHEGYHPMDFRSGEWHIAKPDGTSDDNVRVLGIFISENTGKVVVSIQSDVYGYNEHGHATVSPDQIALVLKEE